MDLARAMAVVEERGTFMDRARINAIVHGRDPEPEAVAYLVSHQHAGGGFHYGWTMKDPGSSRAEKPGPVSVADTLNALWWMNDLRLLRSGPAGMAAAYLRERQCDDGGWDETPEVASLAPPPWAVPGNPAARTYLSAYASYWLGRVGSPGCSCLERALRFVLSQRRTDGWYTGFAHSTWIATAALALAGSHHRGVVDQGLEALDSRPMPRWADSQLAWALDCLGSAGIGRDGRFVGRAAEELARRQAPDGTWSSEDGEAFVVTGTISAVAALKKVGMLPG